MAIPKAHHTLGVFCTRFWVFRFSHHSLISYLGCIKLCIEKIMRKHENLKKWCKCLKTCIVCNGPKGCQCAHLLHLIDVTISFLESESDQNWWLNLDGRNPNHWWFDSGGLITLSYSMTKTCGGEGMKTLPFKMIPTSSSGGKARLGIKLKKRRGLTGSKNSWNIF